MEVILSIRTVTINRTERVPANKQATIVTTPCPQHHYEYKRNEGCIKTFDMPPPMYNIPPKYIYGGNLINTKRGMITIIGYFGHSTGTNTSQWVGKCACGRYEIRNGISWRKGLKKKSFDACNRCKQIRYKGDPLAYKEFNSYRKAGG